MSLLTAPLLRKDRSYPLPDLPDFVKSVVAQGIAAAWDRIAEAAARQGGDLEAEDEPTLTARLQTALNDLLTEADLPCGFSGSMFQWVEREGAFTSYDDRVLEKRPDLVFRLTDRYPGYQKSPNHGLFVECKIIGPRHPLRLYGGQGIHRYVCGDYAWAMSSALMVGYAHEGYTIPGQLTSFLRGGRSAKASLQTRSLPRSVPEVCARPEAYESVHGRSWSYPGSGRAPGDIRLLHLWLLLPTSGS